MSHYLDHAESVHGMMPRIELEWLYEAAKRMQSIVEIGSWKGRSTFVLCAGCQGMVYSIDPHTWGHIRPGGVPDTYKEFMANLAQFNNITALRMTSEEAAANGLIPPRVEMVFIDGDHTKEMFLKDLQLWAPRASKLLCGHDFDGTRQHTPGIEQGLDEYFGPGKVARGPRSIWYMDI